MDSVLLEQATALLALSLGVSGVFAAIVWAITDKVKKHFEESKRDLYTPLFAFVLSVIFGLLTWLWIGDFSLQSLVPFLLAPWLVAFAGSDYIHMKVKRIKSSSN